jgi:ABC-type uncharacterized transport system involved in gliding motility auxiliary subunit
MNRWVRFSGIVGVVVLIFGVLGGLVLGFGAGSSVQLLMLLHIIAGVAAIIFWFFVVGLSSIQEAEQAIKGRTARFGANLGLYTVVFVGLLVALNWLANRHDKRWDLTEEGVYSLSSQSQKILSGLKKPLKIVAFKGIGMQNEQEAFDLLELMKSANRDQLKIETVDPRTQPHLVDNYGMKRGNVLYLQYGEGDTPGISRINEASEEAIINGVLKLTKGDAKKIYYIVGHGEPELAAEDQNGVKQFVDALSDERLTVESLVLAQSEKIPDDAAAVILCSPEQKLADRERDMLTSYADGGGKLVMFADPRRAESVREISSHFGITVGEDIVVDQVQRLFAGPSLGVQPIVRDYGTHPITQNFSEQNIVIFSQASSVSGPAPTPQGGASPISIIARTGPTAWGETNLAALFDATEPSADKDSKDLEGPVSLAAVYEKKIEDASSKEDKKDATTEPTFDRAARVVVFGDSDWIKNANLMVYAHRDYILNTINWLVGESGGISIRPRSIRKPELTPITAETYLNILSASFIIPEVIFIFGLIVWWKRRTAVTA